MKMRWLRYLACLLASVALTFGLASASDARADELEIHFLNVGRNDGILIRCSGEDAFIDSGTYKWGAVSRDYMQSLGVTRLKYYIGTHAHLDHVGGAPVVLAAFEVGEVLQPHDLVRTAIEISAKNAGERTAVAGQTYRTLTAGQKISVGGAQITCLGPLSIEKPNIYSGTENANSMVLRVEYGSVRVLLTGDATNAELNAIEQANPGALKANVYKNAHHGANTRDPIIEAASPEWVIFSTSDSSKPSTDLTSRLSAAGVRMLATAGKHSGNIVFRTDGSDYRFETQYAAQSLTLRETELAVYEGKSATIRATLKPGNRLKALTYVSDDPSVATVSGSGRVTGVSAGETIIRVFDGVNAEATCRVTVSPATLTLRKTALTVRQGARVAATWKIQPSGAKAVIQWASADESVAKVDERGRITGVYPGETTITATMPSGQVSALTITVKPVSVSRVTIKPSSATLTIGDSKSFAATTSPKNATWTDITWSSADESIATISQDGMLRAVGVGKTTISATTPEGKTRTARITVKPKYVKKILISGETSGLVGGVTGRNQTSLSCEIQPVDATIQDVTWISSNKRIATVDENGIVTGLKDGTVTITCKATDGSGRSARIKITFGKNELTRKRIAPVDGALIAQASRIRYTTNQLEIQMTWVNRSGQTQTVPQQGILTLTTPDGTQIPLMNAATGTRQTMLRNGSSRTITYSIPLNAHPQLIGLDLTSCDATIQIR